MRAGSQDADLACYQADEGLDTAIFDRAGRMGKRHVKDVQIQMGHEVERKRGWSERLWGLFNLLRRGLLRRGLRGAGRLAIGAGYQLLIAARFRQFCLD